MGAFFLMIIAVVPIIASPLVITPIITKINASFNASSFQFGGTSLLIVIGVALETFRDLEAQLTMRHYKGFLG
jgi:preprotein translocase subunit SecY